LIKGDANMDKAVRLVKEMSRFSKRRGITGW
jgi:hypothetical protein